MHEVGLLLHPQWDAVQIVPTDPTDGYPIFVFCLS